MWNRLCALTLAFVLAAQLTFAATSAATQEVDWATFQRENAKRARARTADIRLADGTSVKVVVLEIAEDGLSVQPNRSTKQFKETNGKALVPRDAVQSVQFHGRMGRKALWGTLIGAGAGAAIAAGVAVGCNGGQCEGAAAGAGALGLAAVAVVGGWAIGHYSDQKFPEYRIVRK